MTSVVGIAGSPRRNGNSEILLDRFLAGARAADGEVTKLVAVELDVEACVGCENCWEDGRCVTDAHGVPGLDFMRYGVGQARRGWLGAVDVLNTRPLADLKRCGRDRGKHA